HHHYLFLFPTTPPHPRSTLFPYTTLFRSRTTPRRPDGQSGREHLCLGCERARSFQSRHRRRPDRHSRRYSAGRGKLRECRSGRRSEEHTSELQSRGHLVCRLLLEKKKKEK